MIEFNAQMQRKPDAFNTCRCRIVAVEEVDAFVMDDILRSPMKDRELIAKHAEEMGYDPETGTEHCLLILKKGTEDGLLVDSSGFNYCRYASFAPLIRPCMKQQVQEVAESIISKVASTTGEAVISFEEIDERCGFKVTQENSMLDAFMDEVMDSHRLWKYDMKETGVYLQVSPEYYQNHSEGHFEPQM